MLRSNSIWAKIKQAFYNVNISSKIIVPYIGMAVLISIFGGYAVATWATNFMDTAARTQIVAATSATSRTFTLYEQQIKTYARALSNSTELAPSLRSNDATAIRQLVLPYTVTFDTDFFEILDADGTVVLNSNGPYVEGTNINSLQLIKNAAVDMNMAQLIDTPTGPSMTAVASVKDTKGRAGYVLLGYNANAAFLERIKRIAGQDISLFRDESLIATTRRDNWQAGCSTGGCHKQGFAGAISSDIQIGGKPPEITDMLGHSYMIDHRTLILSGEPAAFFTILMPMDDIIRTQNIIKGSVFLLASLLLIIITGLGFFISRGIANPLRNLSDIAKKVSRGDLTPRAEYPGLTDEIGELSLSFNKMTESLQRYTANLRKRLLELSVLYETSVSTRQVYSLDNLYEVIIQNASKAVNADCGSLLILDESGTSLTLAAGYNIPASLLNKLRVDVSSGSYAWVDKKIKRIDNDTKSALKIICVAAETVGEDKARLLVRQDPDKKIRDLLIATNSSSLLSAPLNTHDSMLGVINLGRSETKPSFADEDRNFLSTMASQAAAYINNRLLIDSLRQSYIATVRALAEATDAKDHYTRGHSGRVAKYAVAIARELKLPANDIEGVETAAYLHDVGKIGISDKILMKPGRLTLDEMETVRGHPKIGANILSPINFPWEIVPIVFQHHERYSGGGYPNKLSYDNIHIGARILNVADSYEAMTSERPYRAALSHQTAVDELKKGSGTQFDPLVVDAFLRLIENGLDVEVESDESRLLSE